MWHPVVRAGSKTTALRRCAAILSVLPMPSPGAAPHAPRPNICPHPAAFGSLRRHGFRGYLRVATDKSGLSGLARRYAVALYDLADEAHRLDAVAGDLRNIRAALDE